MNAESIHIDPACYKPILFSLVTITLLRYRGHTRFIKTKNAKIDEGQHINRHLEEPVLQTVE